MVSDQRAHARVSFFVSGDLYKEPSGERVGRVIIRDLSTSGLRVETLFPLEKGDVVYLDFAVEKKFKFEKSKLSVKRNYRHSGSYLTGLAFESDEDRKLVRKAILYVIEQD